MNYFKIKKYDANNWEGINTTIFFSGCRFRCPGCFNSELWDFNVGKKFDFATIQTVVDYAKSEHVDGVCILGGEPFQQDLILLDVFINSLLYQVGKPIHMWSGYTFEELCKNKDALTILKKVDTLVDGQFVRELKDLTLKYKGSSNQRVIDVKRSLQEDRVVLIS